MQALRRTDISRISRGVFGRLALLAGLSMGVQVCLANTDRPERIVIAGDSTASTYEQSRHPRMGWGQVLDRFFVPEISVLNRAVSGRSTKSYVDLGHFAPLAAELKPGDVLLIQFGHNDAKADDPIRYADPEQAYPAGLMRFVDAARQAGAMPVLLTPVTRRYFDATGKLTDSHTPYANAVRKLAAAEQLPLLDLTKLSMDYVAALGPEASKAYFTHDPALGLIDDTHFTERGALAMACLVSGGLIELGVLSKADTIRDTDCALPDNVSARLASQPRSSLIEHADRIIAMQPGPHGGQGLTLASPFFQSAPDLDLVFRRRVLRDGASIGLHAHGRDEIYYVLSGRAELTLDGKLHTLVPGSAVLTRDGSTHSLRQIGTEELAILIVYKKDPPTP